MQFKNVCELRLYAIRKYWLFLYRGSILEGCFRKVLLDMPENRIVKRNCLRPAFSDRDRFKFCVNLKQFRF